MRSVILELCTYFIQNQRIDVRGVIEYIPKIFYFVAKKIICSKNNNLNKKDKKDSAGCCSLFFF